MRERRVCDLARRAGGGDSALTSLLWTWRCCARLKGVASSLQFLKRSCIGEAVCTSEQQPNLFICCLADLIDGPTLFICKRQVEFHVGAGSGPKVGPSRHR